MDEGFTWDHPQLNSSHFHALANLLSLRNGGQAEPASMLEDMTERSLEVDEDDAATVDTKYVHQLSDSGHVRLRKKFLDCLAEFAANKKGGRTVACTAMKEAENSVTLWVARNEGFLEQEKEVYQTVGGLLGQISSDEGTDSRQT